MAKIRVGSVCAGLALLLASVSAFANGEGCTDQQNLAVARAQAAVSQRLNMLVSTIPTYDLAYVYKQFIEPEKRQYTPDSQANADYETYLSKLESVFQKMQAETQVGIEYECRDSSSDSNCQADGGAWAYVLFYGSYPKKTIYLCTEYFDKASDQIETLFHELSHYAAATDDLAGSWMNPKNMNIVSAPDDAYHIQMFSAGDVQRLLRNQIWFWNWPKK